VPSSPGARLRWGLGIAVTTALVAFGVASIDAGAAPSTPAPDTPGGATAPRGTGRDPVTPTELDRARTLVAGAPLPGASTDVTGGPGLEYLSFELVDSKRDDVRRAALYFYNYTGDTLVKRVVNLTAGVVEATHSATGMQPPATAREVSVAFDVLLADPLGAEFRSRYQRVTGGPFTTVDRVRVTAQTFVSQSTDRTVANCGKHRCVQLITQARGGPYIDITDLVVDLSGRTVARLS
jgi:hypothetical protein